MTPICALLLAAFGPPPFVVAPPVFAASLPAPRVVLAGDIDGDGRADLFSFYAPENGIVDVLRMSAAGKPLGPVRAHAGFGKDALAACSGTFAEPGRAAILALMSDGKVRLFHAAQGRIFTKDDLAATLPPKLMPKSPVRALSGDFDGDGRTDALLAGADGRMVLLRNAGANGGARSVVPAGVGADGAAPSTFGILPISGSIGRVAQICAGDFDGTGRSALAWLDEGGTLHRGTLTVAGSAKCKVQSAKCKVQSACPCHLAAGRFLGGKTADLLIGETLLPGGDPGRAIPVQGLSDTAGDFAWIAADCDGDGHDDLIRVRRSGERFTGDDVLISFSRPGFTDSSGDGLLDAWKTGEIKPGGLDLAALGCKVGRRDIIVEVQRTDNTPDAVVHTEMERVIRYFGGLPLINPDGSWGIRLHVIFREPIAQADRGRSWWDLGARYHPESHRGITHWMVVYNGGGGQSGEMTDRGGCGVHALYATFIHEFGHQLGLPHTGFWSGWSPTYSSLMNYTYSYQLGGRPDAIGYSDGRLSSVILNETHLDEHLPLPPDKISFLAGPPYHFHLKPDPENGGTLVDWNWDGIYGERDVAAAINYGYGTTAGVRHTIGKTYTAPALATTKNGENGRDETLVVFAGRLPDGAPLPPADGSAQKPGLATDNPGRLVARTWLGRSVDADGPKWSDETVLEASGVTGDPSAATLDGAAWLAYPTKDGVVVRRVTAEVNAKGKVKSEKGKMNGAAADRSALPTLHFPLCTAVPESAGAQVTLAPIGHRLALLLWRDAKTPVGLRILSERNGALQIGTEQPLGFTSNGPVGAAAGARTRGGESLWVGLRQDQDARRTSRWQVRRLEVNGDSVKEVEKQWVGGEKGQERGSGRAILLWEPDRTVGPAGRLYFLCTGTYTPQAPWQCHYVSMQVGDRSVNGGWLTRRYYDEWTQSRSAPGACWFRGDFAFASRWMGNVHGTENDNLFVGFHGRGIESAPMGDFDDIGFIRDVGMRHSIPWVTE